MLLNIIVVLFGLAVIAIGVKSVITRRATLWTMEDSESDTDGFPAILIGLLEIAIGVYILVEHRTPF